MICLAIVLVVLSWSGFGRDDGDSFGRSFHKISRVV
jgi:hypothetical protein